MKKNFIKERTKMISSMGKNMNATPLEPRPNYFELRPTASVRNKIPRYPASELMNSFESKSAINKMINSATSQARALAQNDELNAQMRTKSIESGIPFSHLEAAAGMIPADVPQELYDRMAAVRTSAVASAEKRMLDEAADVARQARADRDARALIRAMPTPPAAPFEAPPFGTSAPFLA